MLCKFVTAAVVRSFFLTHWRGDQAFTAGLRQGKPCELHCRWSEDAMSASGADRWEKGKEGVEPL